MATSKGIGLFLVGVVARPGATACRDFLFCDGTMLALLSAFFVHVFVALPCFEQRQIAIRKTAGH
jgi:hypothetical protein